MTFIKQLTSSSYWSLNKTMCRKIGIINTLILQHFIDLRYKVFGGEFYQQQDRLQEELGLTEWQVKQSIKFLIENKFIVCVKRGVPAKNYYNISEEEITGLVSENSTNQLGGFHLTRQEDSSSLRKELNKKEKEKEIIKKELNNTSTSIEFLEVNYSSIEDKLDFGKYNNI